MEKLFLKGRFFYPNEFISMYSLPIQISSSRKSVIRAFALIFILGVSACSALKPVSEPLSIPNNLPSKNAELSTQEAQNWWHLDLIKDTIPGMSINRAYSEIIRKKKGDPVIVAVLDAGIDLTHEDLKGVLWTNPGEIAGNGQDNDNNGYVDDVHGYNFLGDAYNEQLEMTRILNLKLGDAALRSQAKAKFETEYAEATQGKQQSQQLINMVDQADQAIQKVLGKEVYDEDDLDNLQSDDPAIQQHVGFLMQMLGFAESIEELKDIFSQSLTYFDEKVNYHLNLEFDGREVVGDDPYDFEDRGYGNGNPQILVPDESHGTHVAGIIAADRKNKLGIKGVANNVAIMSVRAVPNGDEYDKDIALGIRYAVDNGAKIINASFGKGFSPNAEWVYEALQYAASKDVLVVLSAGNEGMDLDLPENANYPNDHQYNNGEEFVDNVLTVGAITEQYGPNLLAPFSNFGAKNVDIFAPGSQIYSTMPENEYELQSGTSMAAPAVSGLAALIRSYYPELTAAQVKKIIMESGLHTSIKVTVGNEMGGENRTLSEISRSGKIANVYNALILARKVAKGEVDL
ncbi:S8 family serine peptidase [Pararhodonellum marinum]|uniref:S8 family serine peptidase n=1 Tax=Pararhodonellum marinum TaxID=2755358 RepID=UPI001E601498|nr:S8 family serine peptidase [Pararhodonellum marinum]